MSFVSVQYLLFLLVAAVAWWLTPVRFRAFTILLFSILFYATWDARGLVLLFAASLITWGAAIRLNRALFIITIILLTGYLMLFKIVPLSIEALGISYYTFKLMSYLIDVRWGLREPERDLGAFLSHLVFFPQIVAGPIQRSESYLTQLRKPEPLSPALVRRAIFRIAAGLFKKLVVADHLAGAVNAVYGNPFHYTGAPLTAAFYVFPIQLYMDFSGLTDIAIGSALLLGIVSPENFDRPFFATSISEYWRRWHMSLTFWLADYVFKPLAMVTRDLGKAGLVLSITINMIAIGLWHGFTWGYFVFGVVHAVFLSIDALTARPRKKLFKRRPDLKPWAGALGWLLTIHLVAFALVFFRAQTLSGAVWILTRMWSPRLNDFLGFIDMTGRHAFVIGLESAILVSVVGAVRRSGWHPFSESPRWLQWSYYGASGLVLLTGLLLLIAQGSPRNPFIYAVF